MSDPFAAQSRDGGRAGDIPPPFSIAADSARDDVLVLVLQGEADMSAADSFREHMERGLSEGARSVVLDLGGVGFMDSTMLRELLRAQAAVRDRGGVAVLAAPQPPVQRLLDITRAAELIPVAADVGAALQRARSDAAGED